MKKYYSLFLFLFLFGKHFSQNYIYGNEWIAYNQKYYKIKLYKEGVYKVDSTTLANSGISLSLINPQNFQIFINGKEQYIHVHGETDGVFNASDFIEFYGNKNNCSFDSSMYSFDAVSISSGNVHLPNPYYSVIQDTAIAFLTWNNSVSNKRFTIDLSDTLFSLNTPASYFFNESVIASNAVYLTGAYNSIGAVDSRYFASEGFADGGFTSGGASDVYSIPSPNAYSGGPMATLTTGFIGSSIDFNLSANSTLDHHVKGEWMDIAGNNTVFSDTFFYGFKNIRINAAINASSLGNNTNVSFTSLVDPTYVNGNSSSVAFVKLWYPQTFNMNGSNFYNFYLPDETLPQAKTFADFSNFNYLPGDSVKAFDITNGKLIYPVMNGPSGKFLVPNSGNTKKVHITTNNLDINVTGLVAVNGTGSFVDYSQQSADSVFLIVTNSKFWNEALLYKSHRQTIGGGDFNVLVANINDLYDQFAYGLVKHPKSIRNFSKFILDTFPSAAPPKYLFLIGKSTVGFYGFYDPAYYNKNLVPTYGSPPSDNLLTAGLNGTFLEPAIPTGRIAATTSQEVLWYLDKVIEHDAMTLAHWQKNIVHFVGGTGQGEQNLFNSYMAGYANIISGLSFGGSVNLFKKNTSSPVQSIIADSIIDVVNSGVSLMTFYGHGSNSAFDINLNDANVYSNQGKYPVVLANSCYAGDIHLLDTISLSERYLFTQNKGAIAFVASVSAGVAQVLANYSTNFYQSLTSTCYGKGIGDIVKNSVIMSQNIFSLSADSTEKLTAMEMALHGDPSVKINPFNKPDYSITNSDLTFNTSLSVDSILVSLKILNLAKAVDDTISVKITRIKPDGSIVNYIKTISAPYNTTTLSFFVPVDFVNGIGLNYFNACVDYANHISEIDDVVNNRTTGDVPFLLTGRDIIPVYPYQYEVVPLTSTIILKASTASAFEPSGNYIFQIDTTDSFNSSFLNTTTINSVGGVLEFQVNTLPQDSTVYFWRVSRDSIDVTGYNWRESSFQTIDSTDGPNHFGWEQAHFLQFKKDDFLFLNYKKSERLFEFPKNKNHIYVLNGFYNFWGGNINDVDVNFNYNSNLVHAAGNSVCGWSFIVIDSISGLIDENHLRADSLTYEFGTCNNNWPSLLNSYDFGYNLYGPGQTNPPDPFWRDSMMKFLQKIHTLPGKYLLGYTNNWWRGIGFPQPLSSYSPALYSELESWGLPTLIETVVDTLPICFLGRRDIGAGNAHWQIDSSKKAMVFQDSIITYWDRAIITSPLIGPSLKWHSLNWRYNSIESNSYDTVNVFVLGKNALTGQVDTLLKLGEDQADVLNLDLIINASTYPFLKLLSIIKDDSLRTAPQMDRWHVLYDPAPEGAINPNPYYVFANDTVAEGDSLCITLPFKNVSEFDFADSLIFTYWVENASNPFIPLPDTLLRSNLHPDSTLLDVFKVSTQGLAGKNALWVHVNSPSNSKYQNEQYDFNNIARIPFEVLVDKINPILDVTFDGVYILNADIVSSKPKILISLKDENKFLGLTDTSAFEIYLRYPGASTDQRVWFANSWIHFISAQLPVNNCKIEFNPILPFDGIYQLNVKAKDRSNNFSGASVYKIQFEVINKPSVTKVLNYPNPFSTSTKFVFTITGFEIPETFMIQIMTISGKVVREIKREELGYIHIGRNITDYAWDGKDEFGDLLANGTYLYRVTTRLNNGILENRESGADAFFTKEIGKMVLIR